MANTSLSEILIEHNKISVTFTESNPTSNEKIGTHTFIDTDNDGDFDVYKRDVASEGYDVIPIHNNDLNLDNKALLLYVEADQAINFYTEQYESLTQDGIKSEVSCQSNSDFLFSQCVFETNMDSTHKSILSAELLFSTSVSYTPEDGSPPIPDYPLHASVTFYLDEDTHVKLVINELYNYADDNQSSSLAKTLLQRAGPLMAEENQNWGDGTTATF